MRTFAYGTDASFYRLNPKLVVKVHTEDEIRRVLPIARRLAVPVTFRAAGTSLSGQAITDSVLLKLSHTGKNFRNYTIHVSQPLLCTCLHSRPGGSPHAYISSADWFSTACFWGKTCFLAVCTAYSSGLSPPLMPTSDVPATPDLADLLLNRPVSCTGGWPPNHCGAWPDWWGDQQDSGCAQEEAQSPHSVQDWARYCGAGPVAAGVYMLPACMLELDYCARSLHEHQRPSS